MSVNLLGIFFIDQYEIILDNLGKIMLGILILIFAYFWLFRRDSLKGYFRSKQQEIEDKIGRQNK